MSSKREPDDGADDDLATLQDREGIGNMDRIHTDSLEPILESFAAEFLQFDPCGLGTKEGMIHHPG
jgi:hypothetical protein